MDSEDTMDNPLLDLDGDPDPPFLQNLTRIKMTKISVFDTQNLLG